MKIELKNIKHFYALSDETNAFSAKLYVDGIFVADCSDTGKGGCIDIRAIKGKEQLLKEAEEYAKSLPSIKTEFDFDLEMDLELFIGQVVEADIVEREFKKSLNKPEANNIVFGKSKKEMQYTWFMAKNNKKIPITSMLSTPYARNMLANRVRKLTEEGYQVFNSNIPDVIFNMHAPDKDPIQE